MGHSCIIKSCHVQFLLLWRILLQLYLVRYHLVIAFKFKRFYLYSNHLITLLIIIKQFELIFSSFHVRFKIINIKTYKFAYIAL